MIKHPTKHFAAGHTVCDRDGRALIKLIAIVTVNGKRCCSYKCCKCGRRVVHALLHNIAAGKITRCRRCKNKANAISRWTP